MKRFFYLLPSLLLLAGCASLGGNQPVPNKVSSLPSAWNLQGKLASQGVGAANFNWVQVGKDSEIRIHAPLGAGAARVVVKGGQLQVDTGDKQYSHDEAWQWLSANGLGVPYQALPYWIQGLPYKKMNYRRLADNVFEQAGWRITLRKLGSTHCRVLPERMVIENGEVRLKFGGMRWQWETSANSSAPSLFNKAELASEACSHG